MLPPTARQCCRPGEPKQRYKEIDCHPHLSQILCFLQSLIALIKLQPRRESQSAFSLIHFGTFSQQPPSAVGLNTLLKPLSLAIETPSPHISPQLAAQRAQQRQNINFRSHHGAQNSAFRGRGSALPPCEHHPLSYQISALCRRRRLIFITYRSPARLPPLPRVHYGSP